MYFNLKGILAPVFTPVDGDGRLKLGVVSQYANHLNENGVDGVLGT
jgi:dihydrodipicolinate synthase/N-acetylneuraminate lyase